MVTAHTAHRTMDTDMGAGIMATTMCMDVNSVVIKAVAVWIDGNRHNKGHKTSKPQGASLFLGGPFSLFGYKRGCWVTATDLRLQNHECGYIPLAYTSYCIHNPHLFQNRQFSVRKLAVLTFWKGFSLFIAA